jgi:cytochrome c oxidase subunit II
VHATTREARTRRAAGLAALALALILGGCGSTLGLPPSATRQGDEVTWLWRILVIAAVLVTLLIWVLTTIVVVAALRRRRHERPDSIPEQHQVRAVLEIVYTATPLLIVMVILGMTFVVTQRVTASEPADLTVRVIGFQWQWQFDYRDRAVTINGDSRTLPQLWLPVDRSVRFEVTSPDVIHSFWVPDFLEKRDMIPGRLNQISADVKEPGQWIGRCAEYCGLDHWAMKFAVCAVDAGAFETWVTETAARAQPVVAGVRADGSGPAEGSPVCPSPLTGTGFTEPTGTGS